MSTPPPSSPPGERIAKRLSRAGAASRREAERMIAEGRVAVNGTVIDSPALNVTARDKIAVDGKPLAEAEPARLWLYHKPKGLVTTAKDEKGRETIFDKLPEDLPRLMSVGRLDLNSEGLLLLTNDGELKRRLELPSTGWLRRYRVRVNGAPDEARLEVLRRGIEIEGERFQPMQVVLDRQKGANAWLTIGLREGKNREIRRAMEAVGLVVNRLIRISYGPFQLGNLPEGGVEEVRGRVLRDQLGAREGAEDAPAMPRRPTGGAKKKKPAFRGDPSKAVAPAFRGEGIRAGFSSNRGGEAKGAKSGEAKPRVYGKPAGKPTGKVADAGLDRKPGKPGGRAAAKPAGKAGERPAGKPPGKAKPRPASTRNSPVPPKRRG
ncbi:pseudouridine synthase [Pseudoroseicyclus sp. H15]